MKNFKKFFMAASLAAAAVMCFAACDSGTADTHEHTYKPDWSYDHESHWHDASCEHTWLQDGKVKHTFTVTEQTPATCTEGGTALRTCICGYSDTITTPAKGHKLTPVAGKQASCTEAGYTEYSVCSVCGEKVGYQPIPMPSHIWGETWAHNENEHWHTCVFGCGTESPHELHDFSNGDCVCGMKAEENPDIAAEAHFTFEKKGDTGYIVTGLAEGCTETDLTIPEYYKQLPVVEIGENAFADSAITSLVIPASVKTVGDYAFDHCEALVEADLPLGLTYLGVQAFNGCKKLEEISIPGGITELGDNTFLNCESLATVTLHSGLTLIDTQVFANCKALQQITLPEGLTYIGQNAFRGSGLTSISVPKMATNGRLASGAFAGCDALTEATLLGGFDYQVGQIFADCKALETLTVPFIGAYAKEEQANTAGVNTVFGYYFGVHEPAKADAALYTATEQAGVTYYIPNSLTALTVNGGVVKVGAFDNCTHLETVEIAEAAKVETIEFENCTATFTYTGELPGPDLSEVTVDKETATVGEDATVTISYTVHERAQVTVTVKKGDAVAEQGADKDYTVSGKAYTFLKDGTYTFEVSATYNKKTETKTSPAVTVELPGPNLGEVTVTGEGYENNRCNKGVELTLNFTYEGDTETQIEVTVQKDGVDAEKGEGKDYTEAEGNKYTFLKTGKYTVTVKATRNEKEESKTVEFRIIDPDAQKPTITEFTVSANTMVEGGDALTLTHKATFQEEENEESHEYRVLRKKGANFEEAEKEYYKVEGDTFQALVAGTYKLEITVIGEWGGSEVKESKEITVTAAEISLALGDGQTTNGWVRRLAGQDSDDAIAYTVTGNYTFGYNVTYEQDIQGATVKAASGETGVLVGNAEPNTVVYKVVYTHKVLETKKELAIKVSFVSDLENSPVLGEDPFGGTHGELLNSLGLQLYWDVTDKATEGTQLALSEISYENVQSANTTNVSLIVEHIVRDDTFPWYAYVDGSTEKETGKVAIKLTATKNGATAAATKVFDVIALNDPNSATGMNAYAQKVMGEKSKDIDFDCIMKTDNREEAVLTKEGIVEHRTGEDRNPGDNTFCILPQGKANFKVEFDITILKRKPSENKASFTVQYRAGNRFEDWAGYKNSFYTEGENVKAGCWDEALHGIHWSETCPPATIGVPIHARLTHTLAEGIVEFKWEWSADGDAYSPWLDWQLTATTEAGKASSPIYGIQFAHESGSFSLTNVKLTDLSN